MFSFVQKWQVLIRNHTQFQTNIWVSTNSTFAIKQRKSNRTRLPNNPALFPFYSLLPPSCTLLPVPSSRRTYRTKLPTIQRLRKDAIIQQLESIPLMRALGLEIPEDPPLRLRLKGIELRLDIASHIALHHIVPGCDVGFWGAGAHEGGARECAVIAGAYAVAVQCARAVRHCACPFADYDPFVHIGGVGGYVVADELAMFP